ncbi:MAG TPA: STAS domain-containing protein [Armatimonadota bacterium]|jgi:anti-anti-sigma factor|nr:STAS domain-containing protein [Armatimonadota bacterium]HOP79554.1 STAS domain-containing protein [Armatimonadota bacterium]HPP73662.1 STAS domain-containing protein [Armatimonadota bacterium]
MIEEVNLRSMGGFGVATIVGSGELDLTKADDLSWALNRAISAGHDIEVDLRNVTFIDSAILSSLATAGKTLADSGKRMTVIVSPDSYPLYVLNLVGFHCLMLIKTDDGHSI